jgi:predicted nucleic acid-binding Zn ribbon protein
MKFCEKCGAQLNDNAQFCTSCGNVITKDSNEQRGSSKQYVNAQTLGYLLEAKDVFLGMLIKPVSTIVSSIESFRMQSALMLSGILAIVNGILGMWLMARVGNAIFGALGGGLSDYGYYGLDNSLPYGKVFISSFILTLLSIGIIAGVSFGANKLISKSDKGFFPLLNVAVCAQVPYMASLFIGTILSYLSVRLFILVLVLGLILTIISAFEGIKKAGEGSENSAAFVTCIVYGISALIMYISYGNFMF